MLQARKIFLRHGVGTGLLLAAALLAADAQIPPEAKQTETKAPPAQDPLNRLSPQSAVISFLEACRSGNIERAARYLDLEQLPRGQRLNDGPRLAQQLGRLLDRDAKFDVADLSKDPQGDLTDGLPPDRERVGSYEAGGKTLELQLERSTRRNGLAVWIFTPDSVALIPQLVQITSDSAIEKYLPTALVGWTLWGTPAWRWIVLALIVIAVAATSRLLARLAIVLLRPILCRFAPEIEGVSLTALAGPVQLLLAGMLLRAGVEWLTPPALLRLYLARACTLLIITGAGWFVAKSVDLILGHIRVRLQARGHTFSRSALPLASRALKIAIVVFCVTAVIGSWGYNTSTVWAGLGIGGIAVALAAQKTIENLFGGVAVVSDRPVAVGDFFKFGDRVGTVEDIGLRSTRVRTLDRTVVSVPNAEFAGMVLENFSSRDKIWFHPTLNLRRDSNPDQVRSILESVQRILTEHPKVEEGSLPVRFVGAGAYSLDIEIFAYIRTADYNEFLQVQTELFLKIMDAIRDAGTALALPMQANISFAEVSKEQSPESQLAAARSAPQWDRH